MTDLHPTSAELLQTAIELLDDHPPTEITLEQVLSRSGVSKGSMYHHYRDFSDLMDRALVARFGRVVDAVIAAVDAVVTGSGTAEQLRSGLLALMREAQGPGQRERRARHVWLIAQAGVRDTMRAELAVQQQRLTDALTASLTTAQEFGWVAPPLDARALVVLAQACTVGRVIDDVVDEPVDPAAWDEVLRHLLDSVVATSSSGLAPAEHAVDGA